MPDLSMCSGMNMDGTIICPIRDQCMRYPNNRRKTYSFVEPKNPTRTCEDFIPR